MRRRFLLILIIILTVVITLVILGAFAMPESSKKVLERLDQEGINYSQFSIAYQDSLEIGGVSFGDTENPALLLIHGSPGSWSDWVNIFTNDSILARFHIIVCDRVGYGKTTIEAKPDLKSQAALYSSVINHFNLKNITMVGHSYGGAVAVQLLVDFPKRFKRAVLVAGTLSPKLMQPRWYNEVADWFWVKYVLSEDFNSSNIEMMGLPESLVEIEAEVPNIQAPIVFIQGDSDVLVPYETADYFKKIKPEGVDYILLEGINHFIPWTEPYIINDVLLKN